MNPKSTLNSIDIIRRVPGNPEGYNIYSKYIEGNMH